jgi:hypothetical protein
MVTTVAERRHETFSWAGFVAFGHACLARVYYLQPDQPWASCVDGVRASCRPRRVELLYVLLVRARTRPGTLETRVPWLADEGA